MSCLDRPCNRWPHSVILEKEGPNDGLVSVASSKWVSSHLQLSCQWLNVIRQQGTYLGTLEDVNHLDLVGWINTARYKWAEIRGKQIKFKPATFYLGVADMLATKVEDVQDGKKDGEMQKASVDATDVSNEN
jgi:triacylglycerol lipase